MNVYISVDMEGMSGVVFPGHVKSGEQDNGRFRNLMTAEVNASIEGALAGGAKRIIVNDCHALGNNILIEELNPAAELLSGVPKPMAMVEGISHEFDAAFFIGYHTMAGTQGGILSHSEVGHVQELSLNGQVVGETGLNAALVGAFDVPVVLVTGDRQTTEEAQSLLGEIETVAVKEGISRTSAQCLHPKAAAEIIKKAAERALKKKVKPFKMASPVRVRLKFKSPLHTDMAALIPGGLRLDGTTLEWTSEDMLSFYSVFRGRIYLAMLEQLVL